MNKSTLYSNIIIIFHFFVSYNVCQEIVRQNFSSKNVPLTLTLSLDLKTSILIVDGFSYHITEGLGVDVSLVIIRVILKKGGIMLLQDTFAKFHFCAIFGHILAYILVHIYS